MCSEWCRIRYRAQPVCEQCGDDSEGSDFDEVSSDGAGDSDDDASMSIESELLSGIDTDTSGD